MGSEFCAAQSSHFARDRYCTASSKAQSAFACEPHGSQAIKRFYRFIEEQYKTVAKSRELRYTEI